MKSLIATALFMLSTSICNSQIIWQMADDTISLTPAVIYSQGEINLSNFIPDKDVTIKGRVRISLNEKELFYYNQKTGFKIEMSDFSNMTLDGLGTFYLADMFSKKMIDSVLRFYRRNLYQTLELNNIVFSSSRRSEYVYQNETLELKNQKQVRGKLCYSDLQNIVILTETGEVKKMTDKDFYFLEIDGFRGNSCRSLYNFLFQNFKKQVELLSVEWRRKAREQSVESMIERFGPFDNLFDLGNGKKVITWREDDKTYIVDIQSYGQTGTSLSRSYSSSGYLNRYLNLNFSPLFVYGYENSFSTTYGFGSSYSQTTTSQNYFGKIGPNKDGTYISIILESGKIVDAFQKNLFVDPRYGTPFSFVSN